MNRTTTTALFSGSVGLTGQLRQRGLVQVAVQALRTGAPTAPIIGAKLSVDNAQAFYHEILSPAWRH